MFKYGNVQLPFRCGESTKRFVEKMSSILFILFFTLYHFILLFLNNNFNIFFLDYVCIAAATHFHESLFRVALELWYNNINNLIAGWVDKL